MLVFSMNFGLHWALFGIGSYAIRPLICIPNTLFVFCMLFLGSLKTFKLHNGWVVFDKHCMFVPKRGFQKCSKKRCPLQSQSAFYLQARRLPERQPHVSTVQTKNSCSSSSWSTVRDFCRTKMTGLEIGVKNWLDCRIVAKKLHGLCEWSLV